MGKVNLFRTIAPFLALASLGGCGAPDFAKIGPSFDQIKDIPASLLSTGKKVVSKKNIIATPTQNHSPLSLETILDDSLANKNIGSDFISSLNYALETDPDIMAKRRDLEARSALVEYTKARKDFQVGTTLYGGIEDIADDTKGVALALNASRLVFDGGKLDSQISSSLFELDAARLELTAAFDQRANELCRIWLELEKYRSLEAQINKRLAVLDPLIEQLEKVAEAGIGDVSRVTAAERTVSAIRVEQTNIGERLAQAELEFVNVFGDLSNDIAFDYAFISSLVPSTITEDLVQRSPLLQSQYANYQASLAYVQALEAEDGFEVGFEARAMRPFAGSGHDSDESIGFVGRKTLFNGGMLHAEIKEAEAVAAAKLSRIKATYRSGSKSVRAAVQNIESMEKAIIVAKENAKLTADEIVHLRQQLIIGGSTLDSVLSAEARLYEAESKEITLLTEKYKSEVLIVSSLGLLSRALGF